VSVALSVSNLGTITRGGWVTVMLMGLTDELDGVKMIITDLGDPVVFVSMLLMNRIPFPVAPVVLICNQLGFDGENETVQLISVTTKQESETPPTLSLMKRFVLLTSNFGSSFSSGFVHEKINRRNANLHKTIRFFIDTVSYKNRQLTNIEKKFSQSNCKSFKNLNPVLTCPSVLSPMDIVQ
jgi:hypothetical protein